MPELTVSEEAKLRRLIADRRHPSLIDSFLYDKGFSGEDAADFYLEHNIRREHLFDCYRMKRNVRIVGGVIAGLSFAMPYFGLPLVVSVGLVAYGIAIVVTGSLLVYQP